MDDGGDAWIFHLHLLSRTALRIKSLGIAEQMFLMARLRQAARQIRSLCNARRDSLDANLDILLLVGRLHMRGSI
jgi:hypothetical protein